MQNQKDTQKREEDKNDSTQKGGNKNTLQQGQDNWAQAQLSDSQQAGNRNIHQQGQQNITGTGEKYQTTESTSTQDDTSPDRGTKTNENEAI